MSVAAAHAAAFFEEVRENQLVWSVRDAAGFPTSTNPSGEVAMPFWSLESRAQAVIASMAAYSGFVPHRIALQEFSSRWLDGLERDGVRVGLNWSGDRATGYDLHPAEVRARL